MADLAKLDPAKTAEVGYEFNLLDPYDGTETDIKIKVRGANSPKVRAHGRQMYRQIQTMEKSAKARQKVFELSLEEAEEMGIKTAAIRVISWTGLTENGKDVPCTEDEVIRILTAYPFIKEQVMAESDNVANFRPE